MEKPLNLKLKEIKEQIANIINQANLPAYILKPIVKEFYSQLEILEQQELIQAEKEYQNSLNKQKNKA